MDAPCPGCGGGTASIAFEKLGLTYRSCGDCGSLFLSPRPAAEALATHARTSPAATFWRNRIPGEIQTARFEKLIRPRAQWVAEALAEHNPGASTGLDLSTQGPAFLAELTAAYPALHRVSPVEATRAAWPEMTGADFVTAFDVLDRAADVGELVAAVWSVLHPGGLFLVTAPCISGFDLQVLWERSTAILPPDKLNLLSIAGFTRLFGPPRWEVIELSTPGMFDVENVRQAMLLAPDAEWPRGIRDLVQQPDADARLEFQEYLQRRRLSSFARLVVRRR